MVIPEIKTMVFCIVENVKYKQIIDFIDPEELDPWEVDQLIIDALRDADMDVNLDMHLDWQGLEKAILTEYGKPTRHLINIFTVMIYKGQVFKLPRID